MDIRRHYELTNETIEFDGHTLHRIICTESLLGVPKGTLGGFIEGYENLGNTAWVGGAAKVYDGAAVTGQAFVAGDACVSHCALISDKAVISGNASVSGSTLFIGGNVHIYGNAIVKPPSSLGLSIMGSACIGADAVIESSYDYIVFKNWWSSGRYFTWTRSNDMWRVGCFYGTGKELIAKAYKDSKVSGREYERVVKYVEAIKKVNKPTIFQRLKKLFCTTYDLCVN